jgi:hypothetical protein
MSRLALCLLLLCAGTTVSAREFRMQGPNGGGGQCPEIVDDSAEIANAVAEATQKPAAKPRTTSTTQRKPVKTTPTARGDSDGGSRLPAPRWHSFLPGMFR